MLFLLQDTLKVNFFIYYLLNINMYIYTKHVLYNIRTILSFKEEN